MDELIGADSRAGDGDNTQRAVPGKRTLRGNARL